ncbi:MAG: hypothetical protein HFJ45_05075 [Clostridia bacterium]|nr:hypothetical protein [Clostridia bacterium]
MSYAIIRNQKYTKEQMIKLCPHNERYKQNYSNKNIDISKTYHNYHLKKPLENNYFKEFKRLKEQNNLKGQLHKNSIYACEMIITSDNSFFKEIGFDETKRYFKTSYDFVCNYKNLGEENIISAVVHLDEETPHLHITFIPVVDSKNKYGNSIRKIGGNDFWKERNSYMLLQDRFYECVRMNGFNLERGKNNPNKTHKTVEELKKETNFYEVKEKLNDNERNSSIYTSIKSFLNYEQFTPESVENNLLKPLLNENNKLMNEIKNLKLELAKNENFIQYYKNMQNENIYLKEKSHSKEIEINAMYNLITKLNNEKDILLETLQQYGINLNEIDKEQK